MKYPDAQNETCHILCAWKTMIFCLKYSLFVYQAAIFYAFWPTGAL